MNDWENIYSEVRKRKMEALNKKKVVKKVEKHGGFLVLDGKYEKASQIFQYIYAKNKKILEGKQITRILDWDLMQYDLILIGCPGLDIPTDAYPKIRDYVTNGGWLLTTDWVITSIIEKVFPGYIAPGENRTEDAVVKCQILNHTHPFLEGVVDEISQNKWANEETGLDEFKWWLEYRSFPIKVLRPRDVKILIASWEIKEKWGEAPVLVYFNYGMGRIIHMISHAVLQKGQEKGKYASALIITNILDEAVSNRGFRKKSTTTSSKKSKSSPEKSIVKQKPMEELWVKPPEILTSSYARDTNLTGTSKILEPRKDQLDLNQLCAYCLYDFNDYDAKIYKCQGCGALYHENCFTRQLDHGICKKCNRILLW